MKIFNLYETESMKVEDVGLKRYINFDAKLMLKSHGRHREKFGKARVNVVERLANVLSIPGHRGKKHKRMTNATGKYTMTLNIVIRAFKLIEDETKENPIQVLIRAIKNSAPRDEITTIEYGGARYPQAVDCSPTRRLNVSLKNLAHGAYDKSMNKKTKIHQALAQEIIFASKASNESFAVKKKSEIEKQTDAAR